MAQETSQTVINPEFTPPVELPSENFQAVGAQDMADNGNKIYDELKNFSKEYKINLGRTLRHYVKPEEGSKRDAVQDLLTRKGFKLTTDTNGSASHALRVFDSDDFTLELGAQYIEDIYFYGVHTPSLFNFNNPKPEANFAVPDTRGPLSDTFNPPIIGEVEVPRIMDQDLEISDIIGARSEVRGATYKAPLAEGPVDYDITNIAEGGDIPLFDLKRGEKEGKIRKAGYGYSVSYELLRSTNTTLQTLAEHPMQMAFDTTAAIVNEGLNELASGATTYNTGATLDKKAVIKLHGQRPRSTQYNLIVGNLDFIVEYAATDFTFQSSNQAPLTPRNRNFVQEVMGSQIIKERKSDEVNFLGGSNGKALLVDRRFGLRYLFERQGNISESERKPNNQTIRFFNTFNWGFMLLAKADISVNPGIRLVATIQA